MSERIKQLADKIAILEKTHELSGLLSTEKPVKGSLYDGLRDMFPMFRTVIETYESGRISEERAYKMLSNGWAIVKDMVDSAISQIQTK